MPNEFVARNGVISQNNVNVTGSVTASQGFFGTASFATTSSFAISSSYAQTSSLALAVTGGFSKSFAIINNSNIGATDVGTYNVWRANTPCTASMILGYRDTGTTAAVSASRNGLALVASPLTLSSNDTWVSSSVLQNQNFAVGDILAMSLLSFTGPTNEITIQVSFIY